MASFSCNKSASKKPPPSKLGAAPLSQNKSKALTRSRHSSEDSSDSSEDEKQPSKPKAGELIQRMF